MKKVLIYAPQNAVGLSVMLVRDLCWVAARAADGQAADAAVAEDSVQVVSRDGQDVRCFSGATISAECALDRAGPADAVFVAAFWGAPEEAMTADRALLPWLRNCHDDGVPLAAVSTGAFFLAEAELLDDRVATTYPPFVDAFRRRYPSVSLRPERAITDAGGLYCANGIPAGCDLIVSIVELLHGPEIARQIAREFLIGFSRSYALANVAFDGQKYHHDRQVLTAQQWLERNHGGEVRMDAVAADVGMSPRNFSRRFRAATGDSPNEYLQRVRIESAKDLLRETGLSVAEIGYRIGYGDLGSFVKLFRRLEGVTPLDFRKALVAD